MKIMSIFKLNQDTILLESFCLRNQMRQTFRIDSYLLIAVIIKSGCKILLTPIIFVFLQLLVDVLKFFLSKIE